MRRTGLCFSLPCRRTTRFFLRSFGPRKRRSLSGNPASRKRCAIASDAAVTLPTESVVLISINCLKTSYAVFCLKKKKHASQTHRGVDELKGATKLVVREQ